MNGKREYDLRDQERREQAANVRVGALCRVEKFDPAAMRVDVQPLSKALDERNANLLRTQILRFNDELIDDKHHTREHFIEILAIIDAYEDYCRSHPDYKNNRCICAVANIKRVYNERLQKHDFS